MPYTTFDNNSSPLAVDRASEIADYIAQDKPSAAEKWIDTVFSKVEQLKTFLSL
ncbi:MAG: type II toxin-antitoxin system RelE/ParE family toxin [Candidatus Desulfaltia sp.]|nr:type II toxin-antitoxin system RelE/ParE family toxin [Candidatus Desulfaltia sp.]